jgi:hypothetical protein
MCKPYTLAQIKKRLHIFHLSPEKKQNAHLAKESTQDCTSAYTSSKTYVVAFADKFSKSSSFTRN